jgi:hypothetical protein
VDVENCGVLRFPRGAQELLHQRFGSRKFRALFCMKIRRDSATERAPRDCELT